jgi:hypothetical protein
MSTVLPVLYICMVPFCFVLGLSFYGAFPQGKSLIALTSSFFLDMFCLTSWGVSVVVHILFFIGIGMGKERNIQVLSV